jgi:hypothetical protein
MELLAPEAETVQPPNTLPWLIGAGAGIAILVLLAFLRGLRK